MPEKPSHIIGVIGVRDFNGKVYTNADYIDETLKQHIERNDSKPTAIVTGGGKGVEVLVVAFADFNDIPCRKIPPNIQQYGAVKAFSIRNNAIVFECTELVIFWDGIAPPIPDAIMSAMSLGRRVTVYPLN